MSHFTVAVITKDGDYEKALAPFDENITVEPYISKTVAQLVEHVKERKESHDKCVAEGKDDSWFDKHYGNVDWNDDKSIHEAYVKLWNDSEMFDEEGKTWEENTIFNKPQRRATAVQPGGGRISRCDNLRVL